MPCNSEKQLEFYLQIESDDGMGWEDETTDYCLPNIKFDIGLICQR